MNHFDPEQKKWDDQRKIASHDYPLIGPYDSGYDHALECQALLMKIAGLDGVIIDWYGTSDLNDHAMNHHNTQKFIQWLKKAGLSFAVCYEECAYFWRMMRLACHEDTTLPELDGFDHGKMPEPTFPLMLKFVEEAVKN